MDKKIHPNFIKSSNLIFISFAIGWITLFLTRDQLITAEQKTVAALTMFFIFGLGLLVRQGYDWVKYLLLVFTIIGLLGMLMTIGSILMNPITGLISIIQAVLQVWSMALLFKIPKRVNDSSTNRSVE